LRHRPGTPALVRCPFLLSGATATDFLSSAIVQAARDLLVIKCLRPDRLVQATARFVRVVFEADLAIEAEYNLQNMVNNEVAPAIPLALVSVSGYDASYRVENLVRDSGARCASVAMGSQEGFTLADQAIALAARQGTWVLLKNVHLAPSWLGQLEKKLQTLNPHRNFRLFLTMEANPSIPVNILRQSRILMNEPPPGIKANLLDSLRSITPARLSQGPAEKARLYFLLAWFHAVVQERLRYVPLGWSKIYDFNDSDMASAFDTIDSWMGGAARGRANVDPLSIPWDAIKTLVKQAVYGGRVDSEFDQRILDAFVDGLFTPAAYNVDFDLVAAAGDVKALVAPDGTKLEHFLSWTQSLPDREPPSWLSLPPTAERVIAVAQGMGILS
jgi:dynein heavy chain 1